MGGLGFGLAGATGVRMALPERPVVAVVGDGSSLYGIQALWSASHYERVGVLFVILSNGGYAIMDRLAERHGADAPVAAFGELDVAGDRPRFGCEPRRIETHDELTAALDEVVPTLAARAASRSSSTSRSRRRRRSPLKRRGGTHGSPAGPLLRLGNSACRLALRRERSPASARGPALALLGLGAWCLRRCTSGASTTDSKALTLRQAKPT